MVMFFVTVFGADGRLAGHLTTHFWISVFDRFILAFRCYLCLLSSSMPLA
jgi:hypothetical protein